MYVKSWGQVLWSWGGGNSTLKSVQLSILEFNLIAHSTSLCLVKYWMGGGGTIGPPASAPH